MCQSKENKNHIHIYIHTLIFIYFFEYETIVRSSPWSLGHSDPDPSRVFWQSLLYV